VSFIVIVILCAVFCLSVVCYFACCVILCVVSYCSTTATGYKLICSQNNRETKSVAHFGKKIPNIKFHKNSSGSCSGPCGQIDEQAEES
jgi:hypothetical protein